VVAVVMTKLGLRVYVAAVAVPAATDVLVVVVLLLRMVVREVDVVETVVARLYDADVLNEVDVASVLTVLSAVLVEAVLASSEVTLVVDLTVAVEEEEEEAVEVETVEE
jgi:hypothetical protein